MTSDVNQQLVASELVVVPVWQDAIEAPTFKAASTRRQQGSRYVSSPPSTSLFSTSLPSPLTTPSYQKKPPAGTANKCGTPETAAVVDSDGNVTCPSCGLVNTLAGNRQEAEKEKFITAVNGEVTGKASPPHSRLVNRSTKG